MSEVKKCIRSLAIGSLLLAVNGLFETGLIPSQYPTYRSSSIYLLALSVSLIVRYYLLVAGRRRVKRTVLQTAVMIFLLFLFRGLKYTVFGNVSPLGRYCWYLYYVPMLCIPMLLFFAALYIYSPDPKRVRRTWGWAYAVTLLFALLVLTNDFHQLVFRFRPGFADWDGDYSYGLGFTLATVWEYALYTAAVGILVLRYPIAGIKRWSWLILVPFVIGITAIILLSLGKMPKIHGRNPVELPEILCFMAAAVLECAMQLGLIPVNDSCSRVLQISSLPVQITDLQGTPRYRSASAAMLNGEQLGLPDGARMEEHTILHRITLPGGFGFWQEDVAELDRLREEQEQVQERLSEESELIRLQNEQKARQESIEQRTFLYDEIARRTQRQSLAISEISQRAIRTTDPALRDSCRRQITLYGSYIKRYANLMLLSADHEELSAGELGLSFAEVLRYLNLYGIPGELMNTASGTVRAEKALAVFECFAILLQDNLPELRGVFVNLAEDAGRVLCKITLENVRETFPEQGAEVLEKANIVPFLEFEDDVGYFLLPLSRGGDAV